MDIKLKDLLDKLGTNFAKEQNSNNYKLLNMAYKQLKKLEEEFNKQLSWMDIEKAEGYALDMLGLRVGLPRGTMDDAKYRIRIRAKIAQNLSDGTINTVVEALAMALNTPVTNIHINPLWEDGHPATVRIEEVPVSVLNTAGMTEDELIDITRSIIAAGIKVESINLKGTFKFSPIPDQVVVNNQTGFSNIAMDTGGKFGSILTLD